MKTNKFDSLIAMCAFRYCLGRMTYTVSHCVQYLIDNWELLEQNDKNLITKEIREAIRTKSAGMETDVIEWSRLLQKDRDEH